MSNQMVDVVPNGAVVINERPGFGHVLHYHSLVGTVLLGYLPNPVEL